MHPVYQRPFEVDAKDYPFEDHWFPFRGGNMHYVDEGEGPAVLLLHGNPTWSYLYRNVIKELREDYRLIAPDYLGFGMSSRPFVTFRYTPAEHAESVAALVQHLELEDFVLVVQDWGGPIGMRYAVDHADNLRGAVIMNTWVWRPDFSAQVFSSLMGGWPLGKWLQTRLNFFATRIVPSGIHHKERVTESLKAAYRAPFPTPEARLPTWIFPREIRFSSDWLADIESKIDRLRDVPVFLLWAMKDRAFGKKEILERWQGYFADTEVEKLDDASHYLQEDRPDRVAAAIRNVMDRTTPSESAPPP